MKIRIDELFGAGTVAAVAVFVLAVVPGCQSIEESPSESECEGEVHEIDDRNYCVYKKSEITETGFSCPQGYPARQEMGERVVCSKSDKPMPDEHGEQIKGNSGKQVDTGRSVYRDVDGGSEPETGEDVGERAGRGLPDQIPNECSDAVYRNYFKFDGEIRPRVIHADRRALPWKIVDAGGMDVPEEFDGTWQGVQTLDSSVSFECPPTADQLGLNCTTQEALVIERDAGGATQTIKVAVSLPLDGIDFPSVGTNVSIEVSTRDRGWESLGFTLEKTSDGQPIFAVRRDRQENPDSQDGAFDKQYGPLKFSLDPDIADPDTAVCIAVGTCPQVYRLEPLHLTADKSKVLDPSTKTTVTTASGATYKVWFLAGYRRSFDRVDGFDNGYCTDGFFPEGRYGFARMK